MASSNFIGAHVRRREDPRLITGSATYVGDLMLPGMHYLAILRSPYAHARVKEVNTAAARALPGVLDVVTGADLRGLTLGGGESGEGEGAQQDDDGSSATVSSRLARKRACASTFSAQRSS